MFLFILLLISINVYAVVRVEPARIIINAVNKNSRTGMIEVINKGEEEIELTALLNDWSLDSEDSLIYYEEGQTKYTLNGLIKFNPKKFTLPPGGKQIVRFTISDPEEELPIERRGVIFFEQETEMIDAATGSRIKNQIGSVIYYVPENLKYQFQFLGLRVYKNKESLPQGIELHVRNTGNAHLRYFISYKIVDSENKVVMEDEFEELVILPEFKRVFSFYLLERLDPGKYTFIANFNLYNISKDAEYQIPITIE